MDQSDTPFTERAHDVRMSFGEHLEELRACLIRALIGVGVSAVVTFMFGFRLIEWLARPLLQAQSALGYPAQTIETDPTVGFTTVYLPVCLISAVILASPWVIYQIWVFVVSGLYEHERRTVYLLAPFSTVMAILGVAFTYWVLLPVSLLFFLNFATLYPEIKPQEPGVLMRQLLRAYGATAQTAPSTEGQEVPVLVPQVDQDPAEPVDGMLWIHRGEGSLKAVIGGQVRVLALASKRLITPLPRLGQYVRFAAFMMLGVVIAFQIPVVMLIMGWTGLFDPNQIARLRKYALFGCAVAGAVLTPTDVFSMIVLAVPLYALFEMGLLLMRFADKGGTISE